jgi:tRNA-dihydrouridine synthase
LATLGFLEKPNIQERVRVCKQHLKHSITWKGERVGIAEMKRHYSSYFKAIPNFKEYRTRMVTSNSEDEVLKILKEVQEKFIKY